MEQIARTCFPAAKRVTDRFHVQKLAYEAVQEMRVKARWEALDEESIQIAHAKACGRMYHAPMFSNGDTRKQLLARSIYLLYKKESLWTQSQRERADILFKEYPDIKKAYYLAMRLGLIIINVNLRMSPLQDLQDGMMKWINQDSLHLEEWQERYKHII